MSSSNPDSTMDYSGLMTIDSDWMDDYENITDNPYEDVNNSTYGQDDLSCSLLESLPLIIVSVIIILITYFGNILILVTLRKFKDCFKGTMYMLIGNLAVADTFLTLAWSLHLIEEAHFYSLELFNNPLFCLIKLSITMVSYLNSGLTLMIMSLDRFCAIVFPLRHFLRHRHTRRIWSVIIGTWIVSVIFGFVPSAATVRILETQEITHCRYVKYIPNGLTLGAVGFLIFQIVFNSILCCLVVWTVKAKSKHATAHKRKIMKSKSTLLTEIYILFAICWSPFIIYSILLETKLGPGTREKWMCYQEYMFKLGMFNSTLNWMVYGLSNSKFRKAFKLVLCCKTLPDNRGSVLS